MRNKVILITIGFLCCVLSVAWTDAVTNRADELYWGDRYEEAKSLLEAELPKATSSVQKAELLWRLSRVTLAIGDELKADGAAVEKLFSIYEEAEEYARQSIEASPLSMGYVYRSSSIGRWGETKGPLNALSKAGPMKDDLTLVIDQLKDVDNTIAWYVMGQLYYKLPGWPISFGNLEYAVSYARKAMETIPAERLYPGHYKGIAEMLWKRNWSASTRTSKFKSFEKEFDKRTSKGTLEQHMFYEGKLGSDHVPFYSPVALGKMSDRQEAVMLLQYIEIKYGKWPFHSRADERNFEEIRSALKEYGF